MNQIIFLFGASYILFDGGASLRFNILKQVWITIVVLATVGVMLTAALTGIAAYYVFGISPVVALLLGATLASTDPATLVPIFQQIKIRDRVAQTVVSESAFNDATGAVITFGVLAVAMGTSDFSLAKSLVDLVKQLIIGILAGAAFGYLAALFIAHERWAFLAEYAPMVTLAAVIGAYFAADGLQASGFTAVFRLWHGAGKPDSFGLKMEAGEAKNSMNTWPPLRSSCVVFIFILLGVQVDFGLMHQYLQGGIMVVAIFMLVARPMTVFLCAAGPTGAVELNEMLFMCWTRETGVIPAALAGMLLGMRHPALK